MKRTPRASARLIWMANPMPEQERKNRNKFALNKRVDERLGQDVGAAVK